VRDLETAPDVPDPHRHRSRREAVLRFTPARAGSFIFLCRVFCGNGHENMSGTLNVSG
jgi:heme/copper-type cytochrome/quinol oxidase subunit 2